MNKNIPEVIVIESLNDYSELAAQEIGALLPHLDSSFDKGPVSRELLSAIIESPLHEQLVARGEDGRIVGIATLSIVFGVGAGKTAYLNDFVVDPSIQGAGIGGKVWDAMIDWCKNNGASSLEFTSSPSKEAAQHFYAKKGAEVRQTNFFKKTIE